MKTNAWKTLIKSSEIHEMPKFAPARKLDWKPGLDNYDDGTYVRFKNPTAHAYEREDDDPHSTTKKFVAYDDGTYSVARISWNGSVEHRAMLISLEKIGAAPEFSEGHRDEARTDSSSLSERIVALGYSPDTTVHWIDAVNTHCPDEFLDDGSWVEGDWDDMGSVSLSEYIDNYWDSEELSESELKEILDDIASQDYKIVQD